MSAAVRSCAHSHSEFIRNRTICARSVYSRAHSCVHSSPTDSDCDVSADWTLSTCTHTVAYHIPSLVHETRHGRIAHIGKLDFRIELRVTNEKSTEIAWPSQQQHLKYSVFCLSIAQRILLLLKPMRIYFFIVFAQYTIFRLTQSPYHWRSSPIHPSRFYGF